VPALALPISYDLLCPLNCDPKAWQRI